jgi:hypothetical protein
MGDARPEGFAASGGFHRHPLGGGVGTAQASGSRGLALNEFTRGKSPAYLILTAHLTVRGLRSLAVFVDLKRRRVASMQPLKADEVIFPPGWPTVVEPD